MTDRVQITGTRSETPTKRRLLAAGSIGNMLEWYDFAVYGYLAQYIGNRFFPSDDPLSSLLAAFGAFAAGYLARPLGALIFGQIGDAMGRKNLLTISITVMGISTVCIGLLPSHDQIGPAAGVLLVVFRVLQGISVGGEFPGSIVFLAEHTQKERRGLITSFVETGAFAGFLLGSALAGVLTGMFSDAQMTDGIWRFPFLFGAVIMVIGLFLRRTLTVPETLGRKSKDRLPVIAAIRNHWKDILRVAGMALSANVSFYIMFVFAVSYLTDRMHVSTAKAMDINTMSLVLIMLMAPLGGFLSDRFGRRPVLLTANILLLIATYPLFWLIHHQSTSLIFLGQAGFALIVGALFGASPATMAEVSPKKVRVSILSIGYNVPLALFGGTAPAVATLLIQRTSDDMSPAFYMMLFAFVAVIAVSSLKKSYRDNIET